LALERHFRPGKEIIVERLKGLRGVGVKDLSASNALLVTAPEETWPELVREGGRLDLAWVRIHLNKSIAGGVSAAGRARRGPSTSAAD
jgi:hypothetical protein